MRMMGGHETLYANKEMTTNATETYGNRKKTLHTDRDKLMNGKEYNLKFMKVSTT